MKIFIITFFSTVLLYSQKTNLAPSIPAKDEYFGNKIVDEYRNLEDLESASTQKWMKSQTDYTTSALNQIPKRNFYLEKRLEFDKRQGYTVSDLKITSDDKYFYLKRNANEITSKVYYRNGYLGKEELLYDPQSFAASKNKSLPLGEHEYLINLISPSWDGHRLAISLTEKGKELSEIIIIDVKTKYVHPEVITNSNPSNIGGIRWLDDNSGFFYIYFPIIDTKSSLYGKNTKSILYKLGSDPKKLNDVFSNDNNPELKIGDERYPAVLAFNPKDKYYIGMLVDSEDFRKTFIINKQDLLRGEKKWKPLYDKKDKVYFLHSSGDDIYFLSGYNSSNFKLCRTSVKSPNFIHPEILVPEKKNEVITNYSITSDGIYYTTTKNGVEAKLYFHKNNVDTPIKLPYTSGDIQLQSKGENFSDIWVVCSGWANKEQRFKYDIGKNKFSLEDLVPPIEYPEFKDIIVEEVTVKSYDGVEVPLSLIYNKKLKKDGTALTLINGYGAYAESYSPYFSESYLIWASQGGIVAVPHVRGGGEKGEQWHIDGQKDKKSNSWRDLIACTEFLINKKYSSPEKIAIFGSSAGGILMGRAMTERPDLFGAVIIESGVLNTLRNEFGGTRTTTIQEYGSIKNSEGFKGLLEMDSYQHVKKNIKYPATLVMAGINDPRVAPWESTKFIANLLVSDISTNPQLLKIDYDGGHGGDISVFQRYSNIGDIFAFALWQLGHPDYQPKKK